MSPWSDPEVFWLNVTNAALGLAVAVAVIALLIALGGEVLARARARVPEGPHTYRVPELGTTLADGGEKVEEQEKGDEEQGS